MPRFRCKAVSAAGATVEMVVEAADRAAAVDQVRAKGHLPVRVEEERAGSLMAWLNRDVGRGRAVGVTEAAVLLRELATLVRAGLPLDQALELLAGHGSKPAVRLLIADVLKKVRAGSALADAMAQQGRAFDRFTIGMVRAGEASGALETVLMRTADTMERAQKAKSDLRSALIYPAILLTTAMASVGVIVTVVIPSFREIFEEAGYQLPLATRIVVAIGSAAETFWWLPIALALGFWLFAVRARQTPEGRKAWDRRMLRLPVIGQLLAKSETSRFSFALSMLLGNGVSMLPALEIVRGTLGNAALASAVEDVSRHVKAGRGLAGPLDDTHLFPPLAMRLIRIGEESGRLEDMLAHVAAAYEREVQQDIQRGMTILGPTITVLIALLIGGIIVSILVPMFSIQNLVL